MKIAAKELNISAADSIRALYGDGGLHACTCQMCVSPNSACTAITACQTHDGSRLIIQRFHQGGMRDLKSSAPDCLCVRRARESSSLW